MPELRQRARDDRRAPAVEEVGRWLEKFGGARLPASGLRLYDGQYCAGWRLPFQFSDAIRRIDVLLDVAFPNVAPRIALVDRPTFLTWPHVERDGLLCLGPARAGAARDRPVDAVRETLRDAEQLLECCVAGSNEEDFRSEFGSYWAHKASPGAGAFMSIVAPNGPTRLVSVWRGRHITVLADSDADLRAWLSNRFGTRGPFAPEPALLLWSDRVLLPREYPHRARDVLELASLTSDTGCALLEDIAVAAPEEIVVLLGASSNNGPCFGGILVKAPRGRDKSSRAPHRSYLARGFRQHTLSRDVLLRRTFGPQLVERAEVSRADASWVHGRDADPKAAQLRAHSVALVGCGSVGAGVAVLLAQAGLGGLVFCDPERLTFGNTGRHPLGAADVGKRKAAALAEHIRTRFPHVRSTVSRPSRWEDLPHDDELAACSLIVSAVGDWATESSLNAWHLARGRVPPIIYGWTEPHACAGHAVLVGRTAGCFSCGFTERGDPRLMVTRWSGDTQRREPACGAVFQPYGPVELSHTVSLVAELALDVVLREVADGTHRIWAARRALLDELGAEWTDEWRALAPHAHAGGRVVERRWGQDASCAECGSLGRAA